MSKSERKRRSLYSHRSSPLGSPRPPLPSQGTPSPSGAQRTPSPLGTFGSPKSPVQKKSPRIEESLVKDPTKIPPNKVDRALFLLKFPLINVRPSSSNTGKFVLSESMASDALLSFIEYIYLTIEAHKGVWFGADGFPMSGEMASRPLHLIFFACFSRLSKSYLTYKKRRGKTSTSTGGDVEKKEALVPDEDDSTISLIQVGESSSIQVGESQKGSDESMEEQILLNSQSSTEGIILNHECSIPVGVPDLMIKTFLKSFLNERRMDPLNENTVSWAVMENGLRTNAIIEVEDDNLVNGAVGIYQAACYGIEEAMKGNKVNDIYKGKDIDLLLCGNNKWCYGSLKVADVVTLNDDGNFEIEDRSIQNLFEGRVELLKSYSSDDNASYPAGKYVVGELCLNYHSFWRTWSYKEIHSNDFFLIHSLLKIFLGDSIVKISLKGAKEIISICKEEDQKLSDYMKKNNATNITRINDWKTTFDLESGVF